MAKKLTKRTHGAKAIGAIFSVAPSTVKEWAKAGCPHDTGPHGAFIFCAEEVGAWLKKTGRPTSPGRPAGPGAAALNEARVRKETALALRWETLNAREAGELVRVDEVMELWRQRVTLAKNRFIGLPVSAAPGLFGKSVPEIQADLEKRVHAILLDLSRPLPPNDVKRPATDTPADAVE